jgi:flagellar hook-associated protein 1 FlgK
VGGAIGALVDFLAVDLYRVDERLDALARGLAGATNAVHAAGYTFAGGATTGVAAGAFFAGAGGQPVSARTLALSDAVAASPEAIAASGSANGAADNTIALALASLRTASTLPPPAAGAGAPITFTLPWAAAPEAASIGDFYRASVSGLGTQIRDADSSAQVFKTLAGQADARRQSVSGVAIDEELVQLMKAQQAYAAAAKLVSAVDEMMQSLVNMV